MLLSPSAARGQAGRRSILVETSGCARTRVGHRWARLVPAARTRRCHTLQEVGDVQAAVFAV